MAADADALINDPIARPRVTSISIFTGLPTASIAVSAWRTAISAVASLPAASTGSASRGPSGSIARKRRSGASRLTASSTAQSAARIAAFEPSIPTTIDSSVANFFIVAACNSNAGPQAPSSRGSPQSDDSWGSQPGDLVAVSAAHNSQFDGATLLLAGLHPGARGNGLDLNVWITSDPAVQPPIDLPHTSVARVLANLLSAYRDRQDVIVVGLAGLAAVAEHVPRGVPGGISCSGHCSQRSCQLADCT